MMSIFISHAHADERLAERLQKLLESVSGNGFKVDRSSEEGAIKSGENWRAWIDDKVVGCDVAVVLLTPASFRGKWVLWEAGAVYGVQHERQRNCGLDAENPNFRRVRVLRFGIDPSDLGPLESAQTSDGLKQADVVAFVSEMLEDYRQQLSKEAYRKGMLGLNPAAADFINGAKEDLRYSPIHASEGLVQEWINRLEDAHQKNNDSWIIASKRWINVAFLGAGNADAHVKDKPQAVDFRIHMRIANAHRRRKEWNGMIEQLTLAASLSPNDLVMLRDLGRAYRELKDMSRLEKVMAKMIDLDPQIFTEDREGVAMRCGYFAEQNQWEKVDELLTKANASMIAEDFYLANWQAIARMQVKGPEPSKILFKQLKDSIGDPGEDFWKQATLVNALLALDQLDEARARLESLGLRNRSKDVVESASRFYDRILSAFGCKFDWRAVANI